MTIFFPNFCAWDGIWSKSSNAGPSGPAVGVPPSDRTRMVRSVWSLEGRRNFSQRGKGSVHCRLLYGVSHPSPTSSPTPFRWEIGYVYTLTRGKAFWPIHEYHQWNPPAREHCYDGRRRGWEAAVLGPIWEEWVNMNHTMICSDPTRDFLVKRSLQLHVATRADIFMMNCLTEG